MEIKKSAAANASDALPNPRKNRPFQSALSIRGRLFSGFALFAAIILAVLWLCQVVFLEDIYKLTKIAELKSAASELTSKINDRDISDAAEEIGLRKNVCISVLLIQEGEKVEAIAVSDSVQRCLIHNPLIANHSFYELYEYVESVGGESLQHYRFDIENQVYYATKGTLFNRSEDEESIVYSLIMNDAYGNRLMLMFNSVITPVNATLNTMQILLTVITILVVLLSACLARFLSIRISKPLIDLNEKAKRLAQSDYTVDFTSYGYREICELGETLNHAEEELSKVDKLRNELIANISHDLRTPLTLISGYAEVIRDIPGESTPENLQIIIDEAGRLSSFVNQIMDMSKLQSGAVEMSCVDFSITQSLYSSLERYNKMLRTQEYRFLLDAPIDITVFADRIRFEQAFFNLLNNAITHTGEDKTVYVAQTLTYDSSGKPIAVRISVSDSGEGIEADKLPYIWERYYKVDKVHKRATTGSGLGLCIVKTIMDRMNGNYGVESTPGVGSRFWIELPLSEESIEVNPN